jgi:hypothetical protein
MALQAWFLLGEDEARMAHALSAGYTPAAISDILFGMGI